MNGDTRHRSKRELPRSGIASKSQWVRDKTSQNESHGWPCDIISIHRRRNGKSIRRRKERKKNYNTLFPTFLNRMVVQRDSIVPCLRKQKPCSNMPVYQDLSGKMLSRLHCTCIIANQCIIIIGKCPLRYSMEINQMFPTSEYLRLMLMSLSHKSSNTISCLLKQRRWSLLDMNQIPRAIASGHNNADEFSFPPMLYSMRLSFHIVPKVKKMDLPLFHFKKNYWQHLMTSKNLNLIHRIWNLIKMSIFSYQ